MKTRSASINSSLNAIDTENLCSSDEQTVSTTNEMQGQDPKEVATLNKLMEAAPKKELDTDDVVKSIRTGEESEQEVGKASGTIQLQFNRDFEEIENDLKEKFNSLDQHSGSSVSCDDGENDDNEKDAQNDEDFDKQGSVSNGLNSSITIIIETETENDDDDIGEMSFSKEKGSDYDMYNYILKHDRSKGSMQELNENEESVSNEIDSYSELEQSLVDEIETDSDAFVDKIVEACGAKDLKTDKCFQDLPQNLPRQVDSNLMYHNMNPCSGNEHANDVDDELETSRDTDSMNTNNPDVSCKEIEGILKLASVDTEKDLNNNKIETCPDSQYSDFSDIQDSIPQNVKNSYSVKSIPHDGLVTSETDSERVSPEVFHMTQFSPTEVYGKDHEIGYHGFNQWNSKYPTNGSQSNSTLNTPDPVIFEDCEVVGASWNPDSGVWPDMTENPVPAMNASYADQNSNLGEKQGIKRSYSEAMENMQRGLVNSCSQFSIPPASVFNNLINQGRPPDISTWTAVSSMGSRQGYSIDLVNKPTCKVPPYYQNQVQNPILNDNSVGRNPMAYNRSQTEMLDTASAINPFDDNYINNNVPQLGVNTQLQGHTPQFIPQQNVLWQSGTAVLGSQRFPCQYFYSQPRNLPHYFAPQNPPHVYRPSTAYCLDFASPVSIVQQPLTFISNPPYLNANITRPTPVLASQISQVNCHLLNPSSFGQYSFQPNPVRQCPERIANGVNGHLLNQAGIQPLLGNGAVDIGGQPRYPTNAYVTSSFRKHSPLYTATRLEQGPLMLATSMGQKCQGLNNGNLMTCSNTASSDLIGINKSVSKIAVASASSAYTAAFSVASHEHQLKMSFAGSEKLTKNNLLQIMNTMDTISRDSSAFSDTSTSTFSNQGTSSNERTVISQNETCDVSFEESDAATASVPCSEIDSEYGDVGDSIVTSDVNSNIISSSLSNTTDTNKDFVVSQKEILQEEIQSTSVKSSNASLSSHFIMQKKLFSEIYCKSGTFESQAVNSALDLTKKIQVSENSCSASVEGSLTSFQTIRPIGEPGLPMSSTLNNPSVPTLAYAGGVLVPYMNSIFAAMDNFKKRMETSNPLQQVSSMCAPVISQSQVQQVSMRHDTMSQSMPNTTDCLLSIAQALQNQSSSRPPSKPFVQSTPLINQSLLTNQSLGLQQGVTNPLLYRYVQVPLTLNNL
ncbi:hypothetical protein DPMN_109551 [Dreissena polymorpha]|uniref:Uncharacterized protein n=1 Tax=Dreissena polymorpha TaxID=45954 RepID=A0A9D4KAS7_DREPO|nr:hypothetical protein DPMN_109551 [Dreissena polymorpha]